MIAEALQSRLKVLEDEILRLTKLAAQSTDQVDQDNYWRLTQDLQREARELRSEIRKVSLPTLQLLLKFLRDASYNAIARHRLFGRFEVCTLPCDVDHSRFLDR